MNHDLKNISALGKLVKEYGRSKTSFRKVLIVSLFCLLISGFIFSGAFAPNGGLDQKIVLSILGTIFLLPPVFGIYMLITRRGSSVSLYEHGLIYRYGGKEFITTWDDITSLTESTACRIESKNNEAFNLGMNIEGFEEIALKLRTETLNRMLPKAQDLIARGSSLLFPGLKADSKIPLGKALPDSLVGGGSFRVDSLGITFAEEGANIAWSDVVDFGIRQGEGRRARFDFFFIQDEAHTFQMNYGALPNAHVLLGLCVEMTPQLQREATT